MLNIHRNEKGQTALETAIILIAFIVVASVFAFTILSSGSASTERSEQAISAGLEGVQSSMTTRGAIIANSAAGTTIDNVVFTLSLVAGGDPVDMNSTAVVIGYRDADQMVNSLTWTVAWLGTTDSDALLEEGEMAEVTVDLSALSPLLGTNKAFTLEIKPPKGAVLNINRTTPAAIEKVTELR